MNLRKYLVLTRAGIVEKLYYKASLYINLLGNVIFLIIAYYLWKAIYLSSGTTVIKGLSFEDTMIYVVLAVAMYNFMEVFLVWEIGRNIQSGKIILDIIKPIKFPLYMFFQTSGEVVSNFVAAFIPTVIIVSVITHGRIEFGLHILFFLISMVLGVLINYNINFFIGTVCLYTESIWGINIMKNVIVSLLSGVTIPLTFFPDSLYKIISLLPFQAICNIPLNILIGETEGIYAILVKIAFQFLWFLITMFFSSWFWNKSIKVITVNGG
ncbi:ABC transporter permease [Anaeromicropila populeti]|uniref:ABC-2 type transport system permease protein n=1 Tax=Anaeromicropila populeti TaxID=37658 RepID=A0A1I6LVW0_9FIRM|nr:ABC-2 family transporter protein [Anaeromicropila populeti]SFS07587.1 ABC-2 type transport system permease protein [Anaeromicropila populeti]